MVVVVDVDCCCVVAVVAVSFSHVARRRNERIVIRGRATGSKHSTHGTDRSRTDD